MLLAEQIVHGIFNDALRRLRIDHVRPLPTRTDGNQRSEILDRMQELTTGIVAFANAAAATPPPPPSVPSVMVEEETPVLERISPAVVCLRQEEAESVKGEKAATTQKTVKKAKRPRDTSDMNRLSTNQSQRGAFHVPADIALVLAERPSRLRLSISESADASLGTSDQQQQQQKQKQLPSKKYACVQYAPEFIEWLDRASLLIYKSPEMSKAPPIFAANKDEFALLMETSTIKMPADMRCTGCRRYFRIKTEEDNLVQKVKNLFANLFW
jgi:type IV secretory pathway VirB10-like protein